MTHDYKRNGTTTLLAALDIATGEMIGKCFSHHRHEEFLAFLRIIDSEVPKGVDIHMIPTRAANVTAVIAMATDVGGHYGIVGLPRLRLTVDAPLQSSTCSGRSCNRAR